MVGTTPLILLIEDDNVDREAVHRLLDDDYEILDAATASEGLEILQCRPVDCVLLDFRLPDYTGLKILPEAVKRKLPVIMLTRRGSETIAVEAMKHGCHDYLVKGDLTKTSLTRAIANAIEKAALQRQIQEQRVQLELRSEELEQNNLELQEFAYAASHDLQEPLRSISGFSQLLERKLKDQLDEEGREYFQSIVTSVRRMKALIDDLLGYVRIESHERPFKPNDVGTVVADVVANLDDLIRDSKVEVTHEDLPTVMGDRAELIQLLQNLISNAIKFRSDQSPRVHVTARWDGPDCIFTVRDNGMGIEPEYHKTVFEVFKRLHHPNEYPGNGIGLAICRRVVQRHGGRIWCESEPGKGSLFHFTLPIYRLEKTT